MNCFQKTLPGRRKSSHLRSATMANEKPAMNTKAGAIRPLKKSSAL